MSVVAKPAKKRCGIYKYLVKDNIVFDAIPLNIPEMTCGYVKITAQGHIIILGRDHKDGQGYAWDGCTPKWNILDLWVIGVPDGRTLVDTGKPTTYYASMVHDALCQYQLQLGITRKQADDIFLHYLGDFQLRYVYYAMVRAYGTWVDFTRWVKGVFSRNDVN